MMLVKISLLLARALWKCPTPRAMTASRGKGQLGQTGRSAGERNCETPDPSLYDVVLFVQLLTVVTLWLKTVSENISFMVVELVGCVRAIFESLPWLSPKR